jgi:hypothetical protein
VSEDPAAAQEPVTPQADGSPLEFGEVNDQWRADFHGLLYLGQLTASFEWMGHKIVIRTLTSDEELIIAAMIKEWDQTIAATKAYAVAVCALAVMFIDNQPMPAPLGENGSRDLWARERFSYALRWYDPTIKAIFNRYLELEARVREVLEEMGKAPAPEGGSNDSAGSLSVADYFQEQVSP